jgi:predicted nicotinamide N-methyase
MMIENFTPSESCSELVYFGSSHGSIDIVQSTGDTYCKACLQVNSKDKDNTGLRIHGGAHAAIRFLSENPQFIENLRVCEVGCGTGVLGLVGSRGGSLPSLLVLTDGNIETMEVAKKNINQIVLATNVSKVSCTQLLWGSKSYIDDFFEFLTSTFGTFGLPVVNVVQVLVDQDPSPDPSPDSNPNHGLSIQLEETSCTAAFEDNSGLLDVEKKRPFFDVVIGCELFYYRTKVEDLLFTVLQLTNNSGFFIHSHVFRCPGQDIELISYLKQFGWITLESPLGSFIDPEELDDHPEWYNVHCLISGPEAVLEKILAANNLKVDMMNEVLPINNALTEDDSNTLADRSSKSLKWRVFKGVSVALGIQEKLNMEENTDEIGSLSIASLFLTS